jgi:gamma-glutamylcyclotransferase (GGCT)/AIG2-like uncharacterized protein YtfP
MPNYLAAYGSLRPGARERRVPPLRGVEHLGPCRIPGRLYVAFGYPVLKPGEGQVAADLFRLPRVFDFAVFDAFEDYYPRHPHACWYVRRRILLREPRLHAWVYFYVYRFDRSTHIASGDWVAYRARGSDGIMGHGER